MPHLVLEYTDNIPEFKPQQALAALYQTLKGSGQFEGPDIKSRAVALDCFQVGDGGTEIGFVHLTLSLLTGRTPAIRKDLSTSLLASLAAVCAECAINGARPQLTVEVRELEREFYSKG